MPCVRSSSCRAAATRGSRAAGRWRWARRWRMVPWPWASAAGGR